MHMSRRPAVNDEFDEIPYTGKERRGSSRKSVKDKPEAIKEKFAEQRLAKVVLITPKTDNQTSYKCSRRTC